jgi:hypothetical protein
MTHRANAVAAYCNINLILSKVSYIDFVNDGLEGT